MLGCELVHAVEGKRTRQPGLGYRHLRGRPVDEPRAGKHDGRRIGEVAARLEQGELAAQVDVEVLERFQVATGRAGMAGEVEDHARAGDRLLDQGSVPQVALEVRDTPTLHSSRGGGSISRAAKGSDIRANRA